MTGPNPPVLLDGARVLIVGTGAMGVATARLAAAHGAHVTVAGRDRDRLDRAAAALGDVGADIVLTDVEDATAAHTLLRERPGTDHVAVFTGSSGTPAAGVTDTPVASAQLVFGRFWAAYNMLQASAGWLPAGGSVTLLSGSSSRRPVAGLTVWGTLHGAIEALARNAVLELAPIRVNTIPPAASGSVWTTNSPRTPDAPRTSPPWPSP